MIHVYRRYISLDISILSIPLIENTLQQYMKNNILFNALSAFWVRSLSSIRSMSIETLFTAQRMNLFVNEIFKIVNNIC